MTREYACTVERFREDVARHEIAILRDDAQGRHIRFKRPDSSCYYFDLITWPGSLVIDGDCGTYAFKRLPDMFEFFRSGGSHADAINPSYWAEKVTASCRDGVEKFNWDTFVADVRHFVAQHLESLEPNYEETDEEFEARKAALRAEVEGGIADIENDEFGAVGFIRDFRTECGFHFQDWERSSEEYTFRFIWNLRAIVWGIARYDALKAAGREAANDDGSERVAA